MESENALLDRLDQLYDIGTALSSERNLDILLEKILLAAKGITQADAGTLYLATPDQRFLQFKIIRTDSLNIAINIGHGDPSPPHFPDLPLYVADGSPNLTMIAAYAAVTRQSVNIPDAYEAEGFDFSGTRKFDERMNYRSQSFLTVPMCNHEDTIIGVLQLINAKAPDGSTQPFSITDQKLAESLASQAAIALTNQQLIRQMESLFEASIQMINTAIDEKSPYTGAHCQRVPELTMMLAEAVNETDHGEFADFHLSDVDRYELKIAGLLHDCGKITTPVHVVDKATKLETIFDRIHLIEARFEVLKQRTETQKWKSIAEGMAREDAESEYNSAIEAINDDLAFLKKANLGHERMQDEHLQRIRDIAQKYPWTNSDSQPTPFLTDNELENLSIRAGTLTDVERQIINKHAELTIRMLEKLPWPKQLKNVPEFAGGHHERMDGKGYPRGLTKEQMSVQARIMAIADIFEALTATDRPYKKPMKVSLALRILDDFQKNGHIDPALYQVFVEKKVYQRYAQAFLDANQVDVE